ncbi:uncharacterized protein ASCRUDRAFT_74167 [Ascoidea rubescens DSM 1968]|uniref:Uncharacterized protein n=1 Tax=Ascoidea rubescens DSM 1968 TaxID=1344418 RepID=A0A1D2VSJ2_9ASCO|nr:hypothetical protein ASCRUDRAFT_74167 [Ascoidea rubescens DSM 1968]ODV64570.1 hypothetical protein ASCRUDRAFT_74167 [Ascoidea rubescens DSM 1968]
MLSPDTALTSYASAPDADLPSYFAATAPASSASTGIPDDDLLPQYTSSISNYTIVFKKTEFYTPYDIEKFSYAWKPYLLHLNSTQLNFYSFTDKTIINFLLYLFSKLDQNRLPTLNKKFKKINKKLSQYENSSRSSFLNFNPFTSSSAASSVSFSSSSSVLSKQNNQFNFNLSQSLQEFKLDPNQISLLSILLSNSNYHINNNINSNSNIDNNINNNIDNNIDNNNNDPLSIDLFYSLVDPFPKHSYSLQNCLIGKANDIKDKNFVLRLRIELHQILVKFINLRLQINWYYSINWGIDLSQTIDRRSLIKENNIPRRHYIIANTNANSNSNTNANTNATSTSTSTSTSNPDPITSHHRSNTQSSSVDDYESFQNFYTNYLAKNAFSSTSSNNSNNKFDNNKFQSFYFQRNKHLLSINYLYDMDFVENFSIQNYHNLLHSVPESTPSNQPSLNRSLSLSTTDSQNLTQSDEFSSLSLIHSIDSTNTNLSEPYPLNDLDIFPTNYNFNSNNAFPLDLDSENDDDFKPTKKKNQPTNSPTLVNRNDDYNDNLIINNLFEPECFTNTCLNVNINDELFINKNDLIDLIYSYKCIRSLKKRESWIGKKVVISCRSYFINEYNNNNLDSNDNNNSQIRNSDLNKLNQFDQLNNNELTKCGVNLIKMNNTNSKSTFSNIEDTQMDEKRRNINEIKDNFNILFVLNSDVCKFIKSFRKGQLKFLNDYNFELNKEFKIFNENDKNNNNTNGNKDKDKNKNKNKSKDKTQRKRRGSNAFRFFKSKKQEDICNDLQEIDLDTQEPEQFGNKFDYNKNDLFHTIGFCKELVVLQEGLVG